MEASNPMIFYFYPGLVYNTMPVLNSQYSFYCPPIVEMNQINKQNEKNWFEFSTSLKQNQNQINEDFNATTSKTTDNQIQLQNSQQQLKARNQKVIHSKKKSDKTEYMPNQKHQQKKSNTAYLNQFRNILPNTIHQILSYIQRKNKSIGIITKLVNKYAAQRKVIKLEDQSSADGLNQEISVARFYAYQNHIKNKLSNYVTLQTFKFICTDQNVIYDSQIFSVSQQRIYNRICRIAILYYLKYEVVCVLMSSKRMQKPKKWEHLKINRKIERFIKSGFKDNCQ